MFYYDNSAIQINWIIYTKAWVVINYGMYIGDDVIMLPDINYIGLLCHLYWVESLK